MTYIHRPATRHHPTPTTLDITVARLLRAAMALDCTPDLAAPAALAAADGDRDLLLQARRRLQARFRGDPTEIGRRAIDTITAALTRPDRPATS